MFIIYLLFIYLLFLFFFSEGLQPGVHCDGAPGAGGHLRGAGAGGHGGSGGSGKVFGGGEVGGGGGGRGFDVGTQVAFLLGVVLLVEVQPLKC